jgi:hypothetical protein
MFRCCCAVYGRLPFRLSRADPPRVNLLHREVRVVSEPLANVVRHTFACLPATRGCSIYKIALWMGDEAATAQKHYAHLIPKDSDIELAMRARRTL